MPDPSGPPDSAGKPVAGEPDPAAAHGGTAREPTGELVAGPAEDPVELAVQVDVAPAWVAPLFGALAALTLPWTGYLALTLPAHQDSVNYRSAWVGFDIGLVLLLGTTAYQAWRGHRRVALAATGTATMLVVDAWFDVLTTPPGRDLILSVATALVVELPLAVLCLWIARNADKVVNRRLRQLARRAVRGPAATASRPGALR